MGSLRTFGPLDAVKAQSLQRCHLRMAHAALDLTPACPPTISRPFRCKAEPCGSMPPGATGRIAVNVREVGSGAAKREARKNLLEAARRREIDVVLVWRLDRWGRSVTDLLATLQEL